MLVSKENDKFPCHKSILAARSGDYFMYMCLPMLLVYRYDECVTVTFSSTVLMYHTKNVGFLMCCILFTYMHAHIAFYIYFRIFSNDAHGRMERGT